MCLRRGHGEFNQIEVCVTEQQGREAEGYDFQAIQDLSLIHI